MSKIFTKKSGYTLLDIIITVVIIVGIAIILFIVLNPSKMLAEARNAKRSADIKSIVDAVRLYIVDNKESSIQGLDGSYHMIGTDLTGCEVVCNSTIVAEIDSNILGEALVYFDDFKSNHIAYASQTSENKIIDPDLPKIENVKTIPVKVVPGDIMTIEAEISDRYGIDSVVANIGGIEDVDLKLVSGTNKDGVWQAEWIVHNTEVKRYITEITVANINGFINKKESHWSDPPASGWVSPTSHIDSAGQWTNETSIYDDNLGTYGQNNYGSTGWGQFIEFDLTAPIISDRIRVNADYLDSHIQEVDIDVYKDGVWEDVFQGGQESTWNVQWVEIPYTKGTVEKARFRYNYSTGGYYFWVYEFQFYEAAASLTYPTCAISPTASIRESSASLRTTVTDDGGEPGEYRFMYGETLDYDQTTSWVSGAITGDNVSQSVIGLNGFTKYYVKSQVKNSVATVSCGSDEFTTAPEGAGWVLPTGSTDPDNVWEDESFGRDDNTVTYTRSYHNINDPVWSSFIHLNYPSSVSSDRLRFYALGNSEADAIDVDIYKDSVWEDVYQGPFNDREWVELTYTEGTVTEARIRMHAAYSNHGFFWQLYDFHFWKTANTVDLNVTQDECIDLSSYLMPGYIASIPYDPKVGNSGKTYYAIKRENNDRKITVVACAAELQELITVSR